MARAMKDSGIKWIGEIPEDWVVSRIKYIIQESKDGIKIGPFGSALTNKTTGEGDFNVYSQANLIASDFTQTKNTISAETFADLINYEVFPNDICLSMMGTIGKCKKVPTGIKRGIMDSHLIKIRLSKLVDSRYFEYVYDKDLGGVCFAQMQFDKKGFIMDGLNTSIVKNLSFPLPSIREQIQIANFLDAECARIDAVIEQTRASIEEYKKLKQAVITQAVTKGIHHNRTMKDSGIEWVRELPEDWNIIPSKFLFCNSDARKQDGDEQLTASQQFGIISQERYMELTGAKVVFANKGLEDWKHVEPFDFIISLRSFQGGLEMSETTGCITWHYIVLKPCKMVYSYYYKWLFKSELYINALQRTCSFIRDGQDLRYSNFVQVPLLEPKLEEQKEIAEYLNMKCTEIDKLIKRKKGLLSEVEKYRRSCIFEFATGKKDVL